MTPNRELAAKVLRQITEHPETHRQGMWFAKDDRELGMVDDIVDAGTCGTVGCVAGWAVALHCAHQGVQEGRYRYPWDEARYLLGLDFLDADWLFDARRPHDQVV